MTTPTIAERRAQIRRNSDEAPELTEEQLAVIVAALRTLQPRSSATGDT